MDGQRKFKHLIADTTAFINAVPLNDYAENVYTVPDVMTEVKHKRQIRRLVVLPFDLQVKEPDASALTFVTNFAKKTGDYASLSAIDLKIIALTYQLEKEIVAVHHLRQEPIISKTIASKDKPEEFEDKTQLAGFYFPSKGKSDQNQNEEKNDNTENLAVEISAGREETVDSTNETRTKTTFISKIASEDDAKEDKIEENLENCLSKLSFTSNITLSNQNISAEEQNSETSLTTDRNDESDESDFDDDEDYSDNSDDESAWITPSNIKQVKKEYNTDVIEDKPTLVACMSTDYAIQNVLKQINLHIAALNGKIIKNMRTYILRCYACFKTTSIMTKVFCPNCGHKTLKRVAVSLDENGQQVIHINTRRPLTAKFKNQSLPRPKGGKHSRNPILCEDQPIPKQMPSRVAKTKTNALNEDYIAGYSPFVTRDVDSKSALLRSKGNIKQWARNNDYEEARRKKYFNRLVK